MRTIKILLPITTYIEKEVNLYDHLIDNMVVLAVMQETESLEIRFPSMHPTVTNFVGYILFESMTETVNELYELIAHNQHSVILEKYIDSVVMLENHNFYTMIKNN